MDVSTNPLLRRVHPGSGGSDEHYHTLPCELPTVCDVIRIYSQVMNVTRTLFKQTINVRGELYILLDISHNTLRCKPALLCGDKVSIMCFTMTTIPLYIFFIFSSSFTSSFLKQTLPPPPNPENPYVSESCWSLQTRVRKQNCY